MNIEGSGALVAGGGEVGRQALARELRADLRADLLAVGEVDVQVQRADVHALGLDVAFAPREELRTEISAKFTIERLGADLTAAGLELRDVLADPEELFALSLSARPAG